MDTAQIALYEQSDLEELCCFQNATELFQQTTKHTTFDVIGALRVRINKKLRFYSFENSVLRLKGQNKSTSHKMIQTMNQKQQNFVQNCDFDDE